MKFAPLVVFTAVNPCLLTAWVLYTPVEHNVRKVRGDVTPPQTNSFRGTASSQQPELHHRVVKTKLLPGFSPSIPSTSMVLKSLQYQLFFWRCECVWFWVTLPIVLGQFCCHPFKRGYS